MASNDIGSSSTTPIAADTTKPTTNSYKEFKDSFGKKQVPCDACYVNRKKVLLINPDALKRHYGEAHPERRIKCPSCENKFSSRKDVKEHRNHHH